MLYLVILAGVVIALIIYNNKRATEKEKNLHRENISKSTARPEDVLTEGGIPKKISKNNPSCIYQRCNSLECDGLSINSHVMRKIKAGEKATLWDVHKDLDPHFIKKDGLLDPNRFSSPTKYSNIIIEGNPEFKYEIMCMQVLFDLNECIFKIKKAKDFSKCDFIFRDITDYICDRTFEIAGEIIQKHLDIDNYACQLVISFCTTYLKFRAENGINRKGDIVAVSELLLYVNAIKSVSACAVISQDANTTKDTANDQPSENEKYSQLLTSNGVPHRSPSSKTETTNITHTSRHEIIKQCHEVTQKTHEEFTRLAEFTDLDWFFERIKNIINRQQDEACKIIKEEKITPKKFMYAQMTSLALDFILSGRYCIYRGTLNMEGRDLKKLFLHINRKQQRLGYITKETADDNSKYLEEELKKIG